MTNSTSASLVRQSDDSVLRLETQAEVFACRYEVAAMGNLAFSIATRPNHFIVSFSYYAHAKTFFGEFTSPSAIGKGKQFPIFYNPLNPQQNSRSESAPAGGVPLFVFGIAGPIVISLLYLAMMGGCN